MLRGLALGVGVCAAGAAGFVVSRWYRSSRRDELAARTEGILWPDPPVLEEFTLADHRGRPFGLQQLRGRWSLVSFGYTYCPDICPLLLGYLREIQSRMTGFDDPLQTVFVSVDPARDTTERLAEYVAFFGPDIIGATGAKDDVDDITRTFGVIYFFDEPQGNGSYLVSHSGSLFLTDPAGRLVGVFTAPHDVGDIVTRIRAIADVVTG